MLIKLCYIVIEIMIKIENPEKNSQKHLKIKNKTII